MCCLLEDMLIGSDADELQSSSSIKDAIKRFSSDLAREPATELPEPALLCAEVLESGAARRTYQRRMFS